MVDEWSFNNSARKWQRKMVDLASNQARKISSASHIIAPCIGI
jgi:hypothetical protein